MDGREVSEADKIGDGIPELLGSKRLVTIKVSHDAMQLPG